MVWKSNKKICNKLKYSIGNKLRLVEILLVSKKEVHCNYHLFHSVVIYQSKINRKLQINFYVNRYADIYCSSYILFYMIVPPAWVRENVSAEYTPRKFCDEVGDRNYIILNYINSDLVSIAYYSFTTWEKNGSLRAFSLKEMVITMKEIAMQEKLANSHKKMMYFGHPINHSNSYCLYHSG